MSFVSYVQIFESAPCLYGQVNQDVHCISPQIRVDFQTYLSIARVSSLFKHTFINE